MRNLCHVRCKILDDIDLFGKEPELYFKGNSKRTSFVGKSFTIAYILIYLAFFLYKLYRMIQFKDVSFYQATTFTGETPSIHLTNDVFYGGFALANPMTLKTFVDESIYFPTVVFMEGNKVGNDWNFVPKVVEIEVCKLEKFGHKYRDMFKTKNLENLYCFKDMNEILHGHTTYDVYSYFQINFYPCVNTTENNNMCKSREEITAALALSLVTVKFQDMELTPENYHSPIKERAKELTAPVYMNLYQNIQAYFHIVHIETDVDFIGFELFKNIQTQTYFKYDGTFILPSINDDDILSAPGKAYCHFSIQLTEQILTLKREYTKLTEVLGEVGGLMEVVFSLFRIVSSILTDNLYEQALVNNLFCFDLDKKIVTLKNKKKKVNSGQEEIKIYNSKNISPTLKLSRNPTFINDEMLLNTKNKLNDEVSSKKMIIIKDNSTLPREGTRKKTKKKKIKVKVKSSQNIIEKIENIGNIGNIEKEIKPNNNKNIIESPIKNNDNNNIPNVTPNTIVTNKENEVEKNPEERKIFEHVKLSNWRICFCFCLARRFKNIQNVLLNEGMRIIMEKMDILFMFKKMIKEDRIEDTIYLSKIQIDISEECKQKIKEVYKV